LHQGVDAEQLYAPAHEITHSRLGDAKERSRLGLCEGDFDQRHT
jgi:hypothetical protein